MHGVDDADIRQVLRDIQPGDDEGIGIVRVVVARTATSREIEVAGEACQIVVGGRGHGDIREWVGVVVIVQEFDVPVGTNPAVIDCVPVIGEIESYGDRTDVVVVAQPQDLRAIACDIDPIVGGAAGAVVVDPSVAISVGATLVSDYRFPDRRFGVCPCIRKSP